jgi:hypothetical protein
VFLLMLCTAGCCTVQFLLQPHYPNAIHVNSFFWGGCISVLGHVHVHYFFCSCRLLFLHVNILLNVVPGQLQYQYVILLRIMNKIMLCVLHIFTYSTFIFLFNFLVI